MALTCTVRNSKGNRVYHKDEHIYQLEMSRQKKEGDGRSRRRRSFTAGTKGFSKSDTDLAFQAEVEYYNRRGEGRGEASNGPTRDWTIVDVPRGTERAAMEGAVTSSQEITWQRYNGVRRSKEPAGTNQDAYDNRRFVAERDHFDGMWTEITKDLVVKEAIEQLGYEFDETEYFFYIIAYLRYVSHRASGGFPWLTGNDRRTCSN